MAYTQVLAVSGTNLSALNADGSIYASDIMTGANSAQTVTLPVATAGTFTLTLGANTTAAIPWNATAAQVQAALVLLASIGAGNCIVGVMPGGDPGGGANSGGPWIVSFQGGKANVVVATMTGTGTSLTPSNSITPASLVTGAATGVSAATDMIVYFNAQSTTAGVPFLHIYEVDIMGNLYLIGRLENPNQAIVLGQGAGRSYGGRIRLKVFPGLASVPLSFFLSVEGKGVA